MILQCAPSWSNSRSILQPCSNHALPLPQPCLPPPVTNIMPQHCLNHAPTLPLPHHASVDYRVALLCSKCTEEGTLYLQSEWELVGPKIKMNSIECINQQTAVIRTAVLPHQFMKCSHLATSVLVVLVVLVREECGWRNKLYYISSR